MLGLVERLLRLVETRDQSTTASQVLYLDQATVLQDHKLYRAAVLRARESLSQCNVRRGRGIFWTAATNAAFRRVVPAVSFALFVASSRDSNDLDLHGRWLNFTSLSIGWGHDGRPKGSKGAAQDSGQALHKYRMRGRNPSKAPARFSPGEEGRWGVQPPLAAGADASLGGASSCLTIINGFVISVVGEGVERRDRLQAEGWDPLGVSGFGGESWRFWNTATLFRALRVLKTVISSSVSWQTYASGQVWLD